MTERLSVGTSKCASEETVAEIEDDTEFIREHITAAQKCYPTLGEGVTVTAHGSSAWALGNSAEVVPANTITSQFTIIGVSISNVSDATDIYELHLYYGESDVEFARIPFDANKFGNYAVLITQSPLIPANSKITAKLASEDGDGPSCKVKALYHEHA